jgi:hypothetical protein
MPSAAADPAGGETCWAARCGAPVRRGLTVGGAEVVVDAAPDPAGSLVWARHSSGGWRLTEVDGQPDAGVRRFTPHARTCLAVPAKRALVVVPAPPPSPEPPTGLVGVSQRLAPPDRRAPVLIRSGRCPMGHSCGCCPGPAGRGHFVAASLGKQGKHINDCQLRHPAEDRKCQQPYPARIPPCPERATALQDTPAGRRPADASCVECGLGTARRWVDPDGDSLPWCGGVFPEVCGRCLHSEHAGVCRGCLAGCGEPPGCAIVSRGVA